MREAHIWYRREHPDQRTLSSEFENVNVLSDEFYQELTAHPVPNDLEAIKVLAASPAVLDLFMWLSYRCFTAKGTESIPLFGDFGLANQIGTTDYSRPRRFRAMVEQWLGASRGIGIGKRRAGHQAESGKHGESQGKAAHGDRLPQAMLSVSITVFSLRWA